MTRLPLTIPLGPSETPTSFTSRLAAENGLTADEFCGDWGLAFVQIIWGDRRAIAKIADLSGAYQTSLQEQAFGRHDRIFRHMGQPI
ncbi:MAG: hypothetical protein Q7V17_00755 [Afipia sp.]|nr:hypothetical protein [Afipia sp.]